MQIENGHRAPSISFYLRCLFGSRQAPLRIVAARRTQDSLGKKRQASLTPTKIYRNVELSGCDADSTPAFCASSTPADQQH